MRNAWVIMAFAASACMPAAGLAKGCLKGAAVGAVAGHVAGHHGVAGAAAGCVVGHHRAKVKDKQAQRQPAPAANPPTGHSVAGTPPGR